MVTGVIPGNTIISYTVTNSGCAAAATIPIIVNIAPKPGNITGTSKICYGNGILLADAAIVGGEWISTNNSVATINNSSGMVHGISYGTTLISYTYPNGCGADTLTVTNYLPATPNIVPLNNFALCTNTQFQNYYTSYPQPNSVTFRWSGTDDAIFAHSANNSNCIVNFYGNPSTITLTVTDLATGCYNQTSDTVHPNPTNHDFDNLTISYDADQQQFICFNNVNAGVSYLWGYDDINLVPHSSATDNYQFYDCAGCDAVTNLYYWVVATKDNCSQKVYYNAPTGIPTSPHQLHNNILCYPNPTTGAINILFPVSSTQATIKIYDVTGREVANQTFTNATNPITINTNLIAGNYLLSATTGGRVYRQLISIVK